MPVDVDDNDNVTLGDTVTNVDNVEVAFLVRLAIVVIVLAIVLVFDGSTDTVAPREADPDEDKVIAGVVVERRGVYTLHT